ncbi:broad specificity phosphatase PhoE [Enterococcus sp. PF1-24]|uniref:histidine phosphatase family protein n=1 Tax=unclassified Enterococcus TaxID=2608891 RepID=UPI002473E8BF|nr:MULTISPECIES: histidine phosphatase family protein [unclassified Enterococcus]MDH6363662.1 broad specificity phosphatase PhoE [Enterococcus sp. PFB1-1]MDH6400897.1 broad specificity phosphatase PhoE [Enterococcus sp. PF1-24]
MKKRISLSLVLVSLLAFAGCGTSTTDTSSTAASTVESSVVATEEPQEVVLYVTRHGKTMFNTVHRAQGWSDTPLTDAGVEVAEQLGAGLKAEGIEFVSAYSSDAGRARETARLVLENNGQEDLVLNESSDLREVCFGVYEGDTDENMWNAIAKEMGYESQTALFEAGAIDLEKVVDAVDVIDSEAGMAEDFATVKNRMQTELKAIAEDTEKAGGGNVLVVAHGMSIMAMISDMTDEVPEGGQLPNASVTKIVYKDGNFTVESVGSLEYVEKGAE